MDNRLKPLSPRTINAETVANTYNFVGVQRELLMGPNAGNIVTDNALQAGQITKTGFEVTWSQKLFVGLQHQFNMAYTYAQDFELAEPLPEIAPLDLRYHLTGIYLKKQLRS